MIVQKQQGLNRFIVCIYNMLDEKDMEILRVLRKNSKSSVNAIAKATGIPPATVHHRLRKLGSEGVIRKYTVELDDSKMGFALGAYVFVSVKQGGGEKLDQRLMAQKFAKYEFVEEASVLAGDVDIVLRVKARSMEDLNRFVLDYLRNSPGVEKTKTLLIMYDVKSE
jgi:DNA-binding Lrp family transcriptional regulator